MINKKGRVNPDQEVIQKKDKIKKISINYKLVV